MQTFFSVLFAIIKYVPVVKELWDRLLTEYIKMQIEQMRKADIEAIRKAIYEKDQRDLEGQLFNNPGKPSGLDGVINVPELPGVPNSEASRDKRDPMAK